MDHASVTAIFRARALEAAIKANGGHRSRLVDQVVDYQVANLGRSLFQTEAGPKVGKGCKPLSKGRYHATKWGRENNFDEVHGVVWEARKAGLPIPSVPAIHRQTSAAGWKVGKGGIRGALRSIPGYEPPRITKAVMGLSGTARDLYKVLWADVPKGSVSFVEVSDCHRKLYAPSGNRNTQRSQKARLDAVIRELETTKFMGLSIRCEGSWIAVGRGRAVPQNLYAYAKENVVRTLKLSPGLAFGRGGLWSSEEGLMAKSLVEAVLDEPFVDDNLGVLLGQHSERTLDEKESRADQMRYSAKMGMTSNPKLMDEANHRLTKVEEGRQKNQSALDRIETIHSGEGGFVALWAAAVTWKGLASRTSSLSQRRIEALGKRFAELDASTMPAYAFQMMLWKDTPKALRDPTPPVKPSWHEIHREAEVDLVERPRPVQRDRDGNVIPAFLCDPLHDEPAPPSPKALKARALFAAQAAVQGSFLGPLGR